MTMLIAWLMFGIGFCFGLFFAGAAALPGNREGEDDDGYKGS